MKEVGIRSLGMYVPEKRLTNEDLAELVETSDEWILSRTGISERRIAEGILPSEMAIESAKQAVEKSGFTAEEYSYVITATGTPDTSSPSTSARVARSLAFANSFCFDLSAACSGLIYALIVGVSLLQTRNGKAGLVTSTEKLSSLVDYTDRTTCVLFGDGSASVVLTTEPPYHRILASTLGTDPTGADFVSMGGRESLQTHNQSYIKQDGRAVFRFAVTALKGMIRQMMDQVGLTMNDNFYIVPHQANLRMMENVSKELEIPMERFVMNIQKYGNTSSASIGLALTEAAMEDRFNPGDKLILVGFGGGLTWGALAVEW
jgi:3-oxoacyl-[acyl-carrier-protein] synthase-3